ncbi:MAG: hypothetical protein EBT03_12350, partial [Betaproteobacteria bacterium]|nr:hypothetical protein [Betaproteobacteria bacterium]
EGVVGAYHLRIERPLIIFESEAYTLHLEAILKRITDGRGEEYDGIIVLDGTNTRDVRFDRNVTEIIVFDPKQVKAAFDNEGSFDPESTDVRKNPHDDEDEPSVDLDFRGGDCAILALRMNELSGLPLVGLFDERGDLHHVAIRLRPGWILDVDGPASMKARAEQFHGIGKKRWRTTDPEEIQRQLPGWSGYGDEELDVVDEEAAQILDAAGLSID